MKNVIIVILTLLLVSCDNKIAGTLGGGYVYEFKCSEEKLNRCLDSFAQSSKDSHIPLKWKQYNNWEQIGYGFLKGKIFYLKSDSEFIEEMYFVSVLKSSFGQKSKSLVARTSIRAVFRMTGDYPQWLYFDDISKSDAEIIEKRFQKAVLDKIIKNNCDCGAYKVISKWPPSGNG